jgi:hypothetical protein
MGACPDADAVVSTLQSQMSQAFAGEGAKDNVQAMLAVSINMRVRIDSS